MSNSVHLFSDIMIQTLIRESEGMIPGDILLAMAQTVRYACNMIAEQGTPQGGPIAIASVYFHFLEIMEDRENWIEIEGTEK
jgi:hypothetical protein